MSNDTDKQTAENGSDDDRDDAGRFAAGNAGGPGRPKGEPNKVGADLKADLWDAYQRRGGAKWLETLPPRVFAGLLAKLLPRQLAADLKVTGEVGLRDWASMPDWELQASARVIGYVARRHEGEVYFFENADDALQLRSVQSELSGGKVLPGPRARECLQNALDALKCRLPELAALQERLERELAGPAEQAGQTR